jgi:predicted enzyme related to lactoylglutathione lyase
MVEKLSFVLPVGDLAAAVRFWAELLGTEPTFVDGDRWAQFDHAGARLALAGEDRAADAPGPLLKVADLDKTCAALRAAGCQVSPVTTGAHERRSVANDPDGWPITLYQSLPG